MANSIKKLLTVTTVSLFIFTANVAAAKSSSCGCKNISASCELEQVKSPTWWGWLTGDNSSQFHFFQLMELLHSKPAEQSASRHTETEQDKATS